MMTMPIAPICGALRFAALGAVGLLLAAGAASEAFAQDRDPPFENAPPEIARAAETPFRTETMTFEVGDFTRNYGQIEYKITMNAGDTIVYSWRASDDIYYEFHGHTEEVAGGPEMEVVNYLWGDDNESHGVLTAPVTGLHGWYFLNRSFDTPVEIELTVSGWFELGPGVLDGS